MFTVKVKSGNSTAITHEESVIIAWPGSDAYNDVMRMCSQETRDIGKVSNLLVVQEVYGDEGAHTILRDGNDVFVHSGCGGAFEEPKAIIITDDNESFPNPYDMTDTNYNFIYEGDEVYVMNDHGSTIEAISDKVGFGGSVK